MSFQTEISEGLVAADVLEAVKNYPEEAYANAITKRLNQQFGEKYTHTTEVGNALRFLVSLGILINVEPVQDGSRAAQRKMYRLTKYGGFYAGLLTNRTATSEKRA